MNPGLVRITLVVVLSQRVVVLVQLCEERGDAVSWALVIAYLLAVLGLIGGGSFSIRFTALVILYHLVHNIVSNPGELQVGFQSASWLMVGAVLWVLNHPPVKSSSAGSMAEGMELVRIATYSSPVIASLVENLLLEAGIPAHSTGHFLDEELPGVRVPRKYAAAALEVVEGARQEAAALRVPLEG